MLTNMLISGKTAFLSSLFCLALVAGNLALAGECKEGVAQAVSVQGQVEAIAANTSNWKAVQQGDRFCSGDRLRIGANSRAGITLYDESLVRLAESSSVRFSAPAADGAAWLDLLEGIGHFISRVKHAFQVNTPYVNANIEGTEFTVEAGTEQAWITVLEGRVHARNELGEAVANGGQRVKSLKNQAPQAEAVADPLDAVEWALYYPPVAEPPTLPLSKAVRRSLDAYRRGDLNGAFAALDEEPSVAEDPSLLVYRASLHLQVGNTDAAQEDLEAAQHFPPQRGDVLALMSLIATVRNEHSSALDLAQRAVKVSEDWISAGREGGNAQAASAYLALSYARQAKFQLPEALAAAHQATRATPESPLAWSRQAQLELMFGNLKASTEAARRAVEIDPGQSQSQTTLGFAHLIRLDLDGARQAFEQAASLDQAAPLPRLGLGLVQIREGDLAGGRRQLETAANLDPGNALIRSYLGKAYYEEKRGTLATTQFALAKQFDGLDPTAWFYDAILKQSENRPIEALNELQTSIDLNDNRAVYRSRLLLDQDEAARNASQARIYQDLGFEQLARTEAFKSLQTSTQTHSAHRLLSDSYSGQPLFEKARFSELLQSQLLQPLNSNPIQPQLAASKLGILDGAGPSSSGFSEYTPLFTRNGLDIQLNAIGGNNSAAGDDLILSGMKDKIAFSLGQFHYDTDGWRENNDLEQNIYDAFLQFSITPSTSLQLEYRHQVAESGDLGFRFEPEDFSSIERNNLKRRVGRIGIHHQFDSSSHLIASIINQDILETKAWTESIDYPALPTPLGVFPGTIVSTDITTSDSVALSRELQFIKRLYNHKFTFGGGFYSEDYTRSHLFEEMIRVPPPGPPSLSEVLLVHNLTPSVFDPKFENAYLYSQLALPARISMTLGVAHEDIERFTLKTKQTNPKFGLTWETLETLIIRAVYLENLARPRHMEQTIEPTQVAGFNQLFDDIAGSEIKQVGLGVDAKLSQALSIGAEFNRRDLQEPTLVAGGGDITYEDRDEKRSRAYLYWTATDRLGVHLAHERDKFERKVFLFQALTTERTPVGFSYHWPSGAFLRADGTYVDQEIIRSGVTEQENFWNVDTVVGYRFPKRYGKTEIIVKNLLNKEFSYYDMSFYSGDFLTPAFQPERQVFARFTINF